MTIQQKNKQKKQLIKKLKPNMYWGIDIQEKMKLGYSYKDAYALVSREKIRELFENDERIERE